MRWMVSAVLLVGCVAGLSAQTKSLWRAATPAELESVLPSRATVGKEHIETEMRTATGIRDDADHTIAAVVLITAGYAAEGKYSHFLLVGSPLRLGDVALAPGSYVLGWTRDPDGLLVHLYAADSGGDRGSVLARAGRQPVRVEPFRIWPPSDRKGIQIGRFFIPYTLEP